MYRPDRVPEHTEQALVSYKERHVPVGGFLYFILTNDLMNACHRADNENAESIYHICGWIYNNLPTHSYGSKEAYEAWINA